MEARAIVNVTPAQAARFVPSHSLQTNPILRSSVSITAWAWYLFSLPPSAPRWAQHRRIAIHRLKAAWVGIWQFQKFRAWTSKKNLPPLSHSSAESLCIKLSSAKSRYASFWDRSTDWNVANSMVPPLVNWTPASDASPHKLPHPELCSQFGRNATNKI